MDGNHHYDELMRQVKVVKDRVRAVIHGHSNGLYLHGRPGTSKTYMVRSTLDMLAVNYTASSGHLTPIGLFDLLEENRDRIIVLDDVSALFNQPIALQLLLAALGNPHDGSGVRHVKHQTANGTRVVPFSGGVICMSNLPLDGHHHEILAALRDRINVINFEPSDEQIIALIRKLAEDGVGGVPPDKAKMVAAFLTAECKARGIRPSVRLFVDKALRDYKLWASENCETHWRDLVVSDLEQQLVELQHEVRDLTRAEQIEAEQRVALDVYLTFEPRVDRVQAWTARTGKSQAAFYRRIAELKKAGRLPGSSCAE
jgi:hypothetical protein